MYDGKSLETKCINFIFENGLAVLESEGFTKLCSSCLEQIVKSDELVVDEVTVYNAALKWAEKECERRGFQVCLVRISVLGPVLMFIMLGKNFQQMTF